MGTRKNNAKHSIKLPPLGAYRKEISSVLIMKIIAISLLWFVCFSHPPIPHMSDQKLVEHLLRNSHD